MVTIDKQGDTIVMVDSVTNNIATLSPFAAAWLIKNSEGKVLAYAYDIRNVFKEVTNND